MLVIQITALLAQSTIRYIPNMRKGGDFVVKEVLNPAVSDMIWEGGPVFIDPTPNLNPTLGRVLDERHTDTHPLSAKVALKRNGGYTEPVALRLPRLDALDRKLVSVMEGRE